MTDTVSREEIAALFAGMHSLMALMVRRLAKEDSLDIAELLIDLDALHAQQDQHPVTRDVQNDLREALLGLLGRGPDGEPVTIRRDEVSCVAPMRQSPAYQPRG